MDSSRYSPSASMKSVALAAIWSPLAVEMATASASSTWLLRPSLSRSSMASLYSGSETASVAGLASGWGTLLVVSSSSALASRSPPVDSTFSPALRFSQLAAWTAAPLAPVQTDAGMCESTRCSLGMLVFLPSNWMAMERAAGFRRTPVTPGWSRTTRSSA